VESPLGLGGNRETHRHVLEHSRRLKSAVPEYYGALANTARSYLALWQ
jgi:hypothetical protein